ncbi:MAG: helicase-associated domain-containing protein [Leptospiraceae bacterium]|nr:helicase-associated domain-containing protein [Leptospiraceae bacterium]MDW8305513.1 helicase-associated domain-containing protein [Leptospiraceae bacterium]
MLQEELSKLDKEFLGRIAEIWGVPKPPSEKRALINLLVKIATDEYYLKGVLEKLTPIQVKIYSLLVSSRTTLTLGEISRKINLQPINAEKELAVLVTLMLVYQRKNRERITNTTDRYYPFEEIRSLVSIDSNHRGEKFLVSIKKEIELHGPEKFDPKYIALLGHKTGRRELAESAVKPETLAKVLKTLSEAEMVLVDEAFTNGGIIEINSARVLMDEKKLPVEKTIRRLHAYNILRDVYFIDERYVRVLVIPVELFEYLKKQPLFPKAVGIKELTQRKVSNELDFVLNMKKLLLFISNKGLTLSQGEKLKQADMKKSESALLKMDTNLFPEKSQIHLIEILLPFLKMFDLVDIRGENIILKENYEEFLRREPLGLIKDLIAETAHAAEKRMVGNPVFLPLEMPFYRRTILERCVQLISEAGGLYVKVLVAELLREWVILSPGFRVRDFKNLYIEHRSAIVSALYYMHMFGLLDVEYPKRFIRISELGRHYFFNEPLREDNAPNAVIINPDATLIAIPEKLSIFGTHLLKSFAELKDFDKVYHFQITKETLQDGLLLGNKIDTFIEFLNSVSKTKIPQNLLYLIYEWTEQLPIVTIEEGVVLLETSDPKLTDLLLGQLRGKKIIRKELSPTAMVIEKKKLKEVMEIAEKLEMIVKLIR